MSVSWSPPYSDGGSSITGYQVEYKPVTGLEWVKVNITDNSTDTAILVNDLKEKTEYQFRVSARNEIGLGSCSKPSVLYKTLGRK